MDEREISEILGVRGNVREWLTAVLDGPQIDQHIEQVVAWHARLVRNRENPKLQHSIFTQTSGERIQRLEKFLDLIRNLQSFDQVWEFSSPDSMWQDQCGRGGLCILRDGEVRAVLVTRMS